MPLCCSKYCRLRFASLPKAYPSAFENRRELRCRPARFRCSEWQTRRARLAAICPAISRTKSNAWESKLRPPSAGELIFVGAMRAADLSTNLLPMFVVRRLSHGNLQTDEAEKFSERGRSVWLRNEVATVIQAKGREKIFRSIVTAPA